MITSKTNKRSESGNVLFLILIAVALFAALSYVVTQSTRSGGGSTEREKNILSSAQVTQYPTALRTAIIRMVLGGTAVENIAFNAPAAFGTVSTSRLVFHPDGGGATFQEAPAGLSSTGVSTLNWTYNAEFLVPSVGTDTPGTGNDIIAFLPGISAGICKQANDQLGVSVPSGCTDLTNGVLQANVAITTANVNKNMDDAYSIPATGTPIQGKSGTCVPAFDRKASGCFYDIAGTRYTFYSVLLER